MFEIDILGSLIPDPITMLAQLMATGLLFLAFKKYLWVPVSEYLDKRANIAQKELTDANQAKEDAFEKQKQANAQLQEAAIKAQKIINHSESEAKKIKEEMLSQAQSQAKQKIEHARSQIELQRKDMQSSIRKEIVDVAMLASERLLHEKMNESIDRQMIEDFIKDVDQS